MLSLRVGLKELCPRVITPRDMSRMKAKPRQSSAFMDVHLVSRRSWFDEILWQSSEPRLPQIIRNARLAYPNHFNRKVSCFNKAGRWRVLFWPSSDRQRAAVRSPKLTAYSLLSLQWSYHASTSNTYPLKQCFIQCCY